MRLVRTIRSLTDIRYKMFSSVLTGVGWLIRWRSRNLLLSVIDGSAKERRASESASGGAERRTPPSP
jgi:hypothetical protein